MHDLCQWQQQSHDSQTSNNAKMTANLASVFYTNKHALLSNCYCQGGNINSDSWPVFLKQQSVNNQAKSICIIVP
jgi:hypothetical protein